MADLWQLSAAQLAAGYRRGDFSPLEALDACLARVAHCQPRINAMLHVDPAGARHAAQASQGRWSRQQPIGPLDGVPVSLKDNLHAQHWPTTWGSRLLEGYVAPHDELPVARLRAAGAVFFGKTNLPEFAMQGHSSNLVAGATRNPWNTALTPGGSSGGAAAAVASGCGPLALATDGGGSIRRPASHCGLVGFKPSADLVPRDSGLPEIFLNHEVAGAIGRSVADVGEMLQVLAGREQLRDRSATAGSKILFIPRFAAHPVDAGIARQVRGAARQFEALGHEVDEADSFQLAEPVNALWGVLSSAGLASMLGDAEERPEFRLHPGQLPDIARCTPASLAALGQGLAADSAALFELLACVQQLERRLRPLLASYDFLLTPATAALPWTIENVYPAQIDGVAVGPRGHAVFTAFANAAGLPAIALPAGFVDGLPTGFQLVGRHGADAALLAIGQQYEASHPWADQWPQLS